MSDTLQNELILALQRSHEELRKEIESVNERSNNLDETISRCHDRVTAIEERIEHTAEELLDDIFLADEIIAEEAAEESATEEPAAEEKKEPVETPPTEIIEPEPATEPRKRVRHFV